MCLRKQVLTYQIKRSINERDVNTLMHNVEKWSDIL